MPSLIQRVTEFSRSKQGRSLMRQVQGRLSGRGGKAGKPPRRRTRGR